MKLLLDTHAFLFAINPLERLPTKVQMLLLDLNTERWVSAVSLCEIAIKIRIGKLDLPEDGRFYMEHVAALNAKLLPLEATHTFALFGLPLHHRDPFDRLLIAQAKSERLTLVTQDAAFASYDVPTLW
ncbi:MAG: type II toxin-antitoxin system VapC family toxin [Acidobacteriota bacterium]